MSTHKSPSRRRRDDARRRRQEKRWASKAGEVTTRKATPEDLARMRGEPEQEGTGPVNPTTLAAEVGRVVEVAAARAKFSFSLDDACARLGLDADEVRRLGAARLDHPVDADRVLAVLEPEQEETDR